MANDAVSADDMQDGPDNDARALQMAADALAESGDETRLFMSRDGAVQAGIEAEGLTTLGVLGQSGTWEWEEARDRKSVV